MRVTEIRIENTFGTVSAHFKPGSITRISGPNGSGKSSILRGLAKVFEGGSDPSVVRRGAEKSVVEFTLDDGTVVTRTCQPKRRRKGEANGGAVEYRTETIVLQPDGTPRPAPQTFLNELGEINAIDPAQILRIDVTTAPGRKQLAELLLKIMPISFEPGEVAKALMYRTSVDIPRGETDAIAAEHPAEPVTLDGLKKIAAGITEQRRRIGGTRDDAEGTVNRLQKSLGEDDQADYPGQLAEAEEYRRKVEAAIAERKLQIESEKAAAVQQAFEVLGKADAAVDEEINAKILALQREKAERHEINRTAFEATREVCDKVAKECYAELEAEAGPELAKSVAEVATLKQKVADRQLREGFRREIEIQMKVCQDGHWRYDQMTEVLENIENLRKAKLDSLPIPGLSVEGDQVLVNGIPWQNLNTAKRVELALQLCTLRAGKLGLLLLDDCEHLDSETCELLEKGIVDAGFQLIEARVTDDSVLTIETGCALGA